MKYSYLILTSSFAKLVSKYYQRGRNINKKSNKAKDNKTTYFVVNKLLSFIANNSLTSLCVPNI